MLTVRAAEPHDVPALRAIYRAASLGNAGDREALLANPEALEWDPSTIGRATVLVAVDGDAVVGFATALPSAAAAAEWELDDLFVAPDAQRRGAGRALVDAIARAGRAAGATALAVTGNPHALAFYAAAGFSVIGRAETRFATAPRLRRDL